MGAKVEDSQKSIGNDDSKYGKTVEYDPTFNGPIKNRGCTDVICCILFLICFLGMLAVGVFAYLNGDPSLLLYPTDSQGNLCGYGDYKDKPDLFFFDLVACARVGPAVVTNGCPTTQVCVKECPTTYWSWYPVFLKEEAAERIGSAAALALQQLPGSGRSSMICKDGIDPTLAAYATAKGLKKLIDDDNCASYYYPQGAVLNRCVPSFLSQLVNKTGDVVATIGNSNQTETIKDGFNRTITLTDLTNGQFYLSELLKAVDLGKKILSDMENSKWFLLSGFVLAMVVSFIWIVIMRWIAGFMVWFTILSFMGCFAFASYYTYNTYYQMKVNYTQVDIKFTTDFTYYLTIPKVWLAFGCTTATILLIVILIVLFLRQRIMIAVALIKEGSRSIGGMKFTLIWPIWPFIMQVALLAYWGASCIYLASFNRKVYSTTNSSVLTSNSTYGIETTTSNVVKSGLSSLINDIPCNASANSTAGQVCNFVKYANGEYVVYLQVFMLFMLFWVMNFIIGFGQMALAGAFASYYWAFDKAKHLPVFPVLGSVGRTTLYHMGSIAFGALIIAIIQMIRVGLEYLDHKLKGSENAVAKFFLKCLKCCFWCLEKFMKMINKNAYILVAIYGKNFCVSAKNAFFLIMRNIVRVAVVDKVTDFIMFIGKLVVVGALTALAFYFFAPDTVIKKDAFLTKYRPELNVYWSPVVVIGVGAFVIASCFFSVYGMAVDTLFLCFLEDLERNDGSAEKPYYMNKELKDILGKKNVKESKED